MHKFCACYHYRRYMSRSRVYILRNQFWKMRILICVNHLGLNLALSGNLNVEHYEPVLVPASRWTDKSTTSAPAESAIHCASSCQLREKSGGPKCWQFSFHDGVCKLSGWITEASSASGSTVQTWRTIIGMIYCFCTYC